jgi:hypothetical protein
MRCGRSGITGARRKTLEYTQSLEQQWRILDSTLSSLVDFVHTFYREGRCLYATKPLLDLWA